MAGRYERVNSHDVEEPETPTAPLPRPTYPIPNSPPPSFHSRASSLIGRERNERVNADLVDAFGSEDDDSGDEADDRQRLVRGTSSHSSSESTPASSAASTTSQTVGHSSRTTGPTSVSGSAPPTGGRVYGGGIQSDGVFSNLSARPERGGEEKEEQPPSYEQAAADAAPPYWETTILAPGLGGPDDVFIDGMPVGSFFSFAWNAMIAMLLTPLIGFLLTYLLHSTHAAKNGSRAGLAVTLIQYGFAMKGLQPAGSGASPNPNMGEGYSRPSDPNAYEFDANAVTQGDDDSGMGEITSSDWLAYVLMVVGWFILIRAVSDYLKVRRHERLVLQSPERGLGVPIIATGERPETVV